MIGSLECPKAPHDNPTGGYLHGADDDAPYDVDGVLYCGRCHHACDASGNCARPVKAQRLAESAYRAWNFRDSCARCGFDREDHPHRYETLRTRFGERQWNYCPAFVAASSRVEEGQ